MKSLKDCPEESKARIVSLKAQGPLKRRLLEMGFLPGRKIRVVRNAPLFDPMEIEILGYFLAVRKDEAAYIMVEEDHE